jgi:predicted DNA-binding WGR domain protein
MIPVGLARKFGLTRRGPTITLIEACAMNAVHLFRIDPTRNKHRFYRLDVQTDLFGGVLLMKEWGRIGAQGRVVAEHFEDMALALAAVAQHRARKSRRGYESQIDARRSNRLGWSQASSMAQNAG